jgi:hypothetical protein
VATPEERLSKVEAEVQELRHAEIGAGLRAQAFGLSLVQSEVHELREEVQSGFAAVNGRIDGLDQRMASLEQGIAQILERLDR